MTEQTPIVFIIFNRPDLTQKVLDRIRLYRPEILYVIADGPRESIASDRDLCLKTRRIIETIDWPCELVKDYSEENLGCRMRVSSGITNVFAQFSRAIILEDDCVPHPDFFPYCHELLDRYAEEQRVMHISGTPLAACVESSDYSYYFIQSPLVWGWATWSRAWAHYDVTASRWEQEKQQVLDVMEINSTIKTAICRVIDRARTGQLDTWDFQWLACILMHNGLCAAPKYNMIENIGFDERATHTRKTDDPRCRIPASSIGFPLRHPPVPELDRPRSLAWFKETFPAKKTYWQKLGRKLRKHMKWMGSGNSGF